MIEIWKSLKGIVDNGTFYEISNFGNIRSLDRVVIDKQGKTRIFKGRNKKTKHNNRNYVMVDLCENGEEKTYLLHRLVALAFIDNKNSLPEINHIDGNKENNCVENLEWVTSKENQNHARNNGLSNQHGEKSVNSKLTDIKALEIRKLWDTKNYTQPMLANLFNTSQSSIGRIIRKESYKHI